MTMPLPPPTVEISSRDAHEFLSALKETLRRMTRTQREEVRLIVHERRALAVSFNLRYEAFLGYSAGYNPEDRRTALPKSTKVLRTVRTWLTIRRKEGPKGGRVFLRSDCAFTVPGTDPIVLCEWTWPGPDLVEACCQLLEEFLFRDA